MAVSKYGDINHIGDCRNFSIYCQLLPFQSNSLFPEILRRFRPDCVVVQCGAGSLAHDPLGGFNLTLEGTGPCVRAVVDSGLPALFLGGGGYHSGANSAKYWTYLTSGTSKALHCIRQ